MFYIPLPFHLHSLFYSFFYLSFNSFLPLFLHPLTLVFIPLTSYYNLLPVFFYIPLTSYYNPLPLFYIPLPFHLHLFTRFTLPFPVLQCESPYHLITISYPCFYIALPSLNSFFTLVTNLLTLPLTSYYPCFTLPFPVLQSLTLVFTSP